MRPLAKNELWLRVYGKQHRWDILNVEGEHFIVLSAAKESPMVYRLRCISTKNPLRDLRRLRKNARN